MQHWNWTKNGSLTIQSLNCPCSHWARKLCKQCVRNSKTLWWRMPLRSDSLQTSQKACFIQGPILAKLSTFCEMMRLIAAEVNLIMYKCAIDNPDLWDFEICHLINNEIPFTSKLLLCCGQYLVSVACCLLYCFLCLQDNCSLHPTGFDSYHFCSFNLFDLRKILEDCANRMIGSEQEQRFRVDLQQVFWPHSPNVTIL